MSQEITVVTESLIPSEKMLDAIIRHFGFRTTVVEMVVYAYCTICARIMTSKEVGIMAYIFAFNAL